MHSKLSEVMKGTMYKEYDNKKRALFAIQKWEGRVKLSVCSIRVFYIHNTPQGYVLLFLDTMEVREYDAIQLSPPSSMLKVNDMWKIFCNKCWITIILILSDRLAKCHPLIFVKCVYSTGAFGSIGWSINITVKGSVYGATSDLRLSPWCHPRHPYWPNRVTTATVSSGY